MLPTTACCLAATSCVCAGELEVTLLDYGAGNVRSVRNAIKRCGFSIKEASWGVWVPGGCAGLWCCCVLLVMRGLLRSLLATGCYGHAYWQVPLPLPAPSRQHLPRACRWRAPPTSRARSAWCSRAWVPLGRPCRFWSSGGTRRHSRTTSRWVQRGVCLVVVAGGGGGGGGHRVRCGTAPARAALGGWSWWGLSGHAGCYPCGMLHVHEAPTATGSGGSWHAPAAGLAASTLPARRTDHGPRPPNPFCRPTAPSWACAWACSCCLRGRRRAAAARAWASSPAG